MKRFLLIAIAFLGGISMKAQIEQIVLDTVCTDCPSAGYTCVRVYAEMADANDVISVIYGLEGSPLSISTSCEDCFFNSALGSNTGDQINCDLFPFFPELQYDSWVTVGRDCSSSPGGAIFSLQSPNQPWSVNVCPIEMTDIYGGAWFTTTGAVNGYPDANSRILLAQLTTCGSLEGCINAQVFDNYVQGSSVYIEQHDLCFSSLGCTTAGCTDPEALNYNESACLDNGFCLYPCALEVTNETHSHPTCSYNTNGQVDFDATGSQGILRFYKNGATPTLNGVYNNLGNGTYTFTIKDERFDDPAYNPGNAFGTCQIDSVVVINTPAVVFQMGVPEAASCNGLADGCNVSSASGGTGELSFQASNCAGTQFILDEFGNPVELATPDFCGFGSGSWKYIATDANGCVFNSSCFGITQPPALNINDIFTDAATCGNIADGGVNMQFLGGTGDVDYYVNDVFYENNFISGLLPGNYTVIGEDSEGCQDTDTFTITGPTDVAVNASSTPTLCVGSSDGCVNALAGGGNPGPYTYSIDNVTFSSSTQFCGLMAGEYTVYAHDSQGCSDTIDIVIDSPDGLDAFIDVDNVDCYGGSDGSIDVQGIGGNPNYTYSIDGVTFIDNGIFENLAAGPLTVYLMDSNDCPYQTSTEVTQPDSLSLSLETTDPLCNGEENGEIIVDVNGGTADFDYYLEGVLQAGNVIDDLGADTYSITVVDANGCQIDDEVTLNEPAELEITNVTSTDETTIDGNNGTIDIDVTGGTGDYEYEWTDSNGDVVSTVEDPDGLAPGTYNVVVTDENGCEVDLDSDVLIDDSVIELNDNISLQLNPNPTNGRFVMTLTGLQGEKLSYRIVDTRGRVVLEKELGNTNGVKTEEVNLDGNAGGVYYLTVIAGESTRAVKVVKE